jgi:hypothetical protein
MSFGSNRVDWVCLLRKIQLQVFCSKSRYNGPPGRVISVENRNSENTTNMSLGPAGWIGSVCCGKFNCKFFLFQKSL